MRKRHVLGGAVAAAAFVAAAAVTLPANAIVGGGKAEPLAWAVQVYDVRSGVGDVYQCTGTLIASTWVLTAQHCLADAGETTAVYVGSNELGGGTRIAVDRSEVPSTTGDVALLHLAAAAGRARVTLADADPASNVTGTIYGWGAEADPPPGQRPVMSPVLKTASTLVYSKDKDSLGGPGLVSWSVGGTGAAYKGDSGGPLIVGGVQVGVTSTAEGSAKPDNFNTYASVATHRDWIRTIAGI